MSYRTSLGEIFTPQAIMANMRVMPQVAAAEVAVEDNTVLYVGLGAAALIMIGVVVWRVRST